MHFASLESADFISGAWEIFKYRIQRRSFDRGRRLSAMVTTTLGRTPDGRRVEVAEEIDAPAERLWDLLTDTRRWPEWGPMVSGVVCDDRRIRTGTTGTVETAVGVDLPFEVTSCVGFRWTWAVAGIDATGHRVEPLNGRCRVVFEVPLPAAGYAPVCAVALGNLKEEI
jgi:hypothetical protein